MAIIEDFGYSMYDITTGKVYCIPFSTNLCEVNCRKHERVKDHIGHGTLRVWKWTNGTWSQPYVTEFPEEDGTLAKLCFHDNHSANNLTEWFYIELWFDENNDGKADDVDCGGCGEIFTTWKTLTELLAIYNGTTNIPEWNKTYNYLHLDFCNNNGWDKCLPWGFWETHDCYDSAKTYGIDEPTRFPANVIEANEPEGKKDNPQVGPEEKK